MNTYAVEECGTVQAIYVSEDDAGSPELISHMKAITPPGSTWVYVEESCKIGDDLTIDADGCAAVQRP